MVAQTIAPQLTTDSPEVASQSHLSEVSSVKHSKASFVKLNHLRQNLSLPQAQEIICCFFLEEVKTSAPELVLDKFKSLFIEPTPAVNSVPRHALEHIAALDQEKIFINTFKRSIYILVNNWTAIRQQHYIQELVRLLSVSLDAHKASYITLKRLKLWRSNFVHSQDYKELKIFISRFEHDHWSDRYSSYLLVEQSVDAKKPRQQREAARTRSEQLKEQFKFDLAMYTARCPLAAAQQNTLPNPTILGDEVVDLIQQILQKRGTFSYASLANIFLHQTQLLCYSDFKQSLLNYLLFCLDNQGLSKKIKTQLSKQLEGLYETHHDKPWDNHLLLRTCNRLIDYLTTTDHKNPSALFILLATQDNALTLAILLLKIVLLCPSTYTHLECCIARLIQHYESLSASDCKWLIRFLEVLKVTLTIYTDNVQFNLVNMSDEKCNGYRIFSQTKSGTQVA
ncbi:MAG TPA: hypothetical protein DCE56_16195 [Cyanobacteria bacterium UBA8553]|nr:hypothetical protein [Cyanobacteria bacterium UBA8553]HAJ59530.1 hypothetical protein [Cyanobacteria bacterium UBA8543]